MKSVRLALLGLSGTVWLFGAGCYTEAVLDLPDEIRAVSIIAAAEGRAALESALHCRKQPLYERDALHEQVFPDRFHVLGFDESTVEEMRDPDRLPPHILGGPGSQSSYYPVLWLVVVPDGQVYAQELDPPLPLQTEPEVCR